MTDTQTAPAHAIRAWAKQHGIEVGNRGRLSAELVEKYRAAHA